jgi:hypothetical protein
VGRLLKYLFFLAVIAAAGLSVYALVADLPPPVREVVRELPTPGEGE